MSVTLGELATRFGCKLIGDPDAVVVRLASLQNAGSDALTFLSNPALKAELRTTNAAAVIVRADDAGDLQTSAIISDDPYVTYARMAAIVMPPPDFPAGVHPSAVIANSAEVASDAHIGPNVVIEDGAQIGAACVIGAGTFVGPDSVLENACMLHANVTLVRSVTLGARTIVHSGAVIGADGFGNAMTPEGWLKVPQYGGVKIGSDVEIGANSTVDCGALDDTIIEDGVRIDNLVMIAHNVKIGAHTAMAAMVGIAGSAVIGKRCLFAGQSGTVGHIHVCDDVIVSGRGMVSKDITEPGVYACAFPAEPARQWNRRVAQFRRMDNLLERIATLEKRVDGRGDQ